MQLKVLVINHNSWIYVIVSFDASCWQTCCFSIGINRPQKPEYKSDALFDDHSPFSFFVLVYKQTIIREFDIVWNSQAISCLSSDALCYFPGSRNFRIAFYMSGLDGRIRKRTVWEQDWFVISYPGLYNHCCFSLFVFVFRHGWCPTDTRSGVLYFSLGTPRLLAMRIRDRYKYSSRKFLKITILCSSRLVPQGAWNLITNQHILQLMTSLTYCKTSNWIHIWPVQSSHSSDSPCVHYRIGLCLPSGHNWAVKLPTQAFPLPRFSLLPVIDIHVPIDT
jgi:hypothetical protein